MLKTKKCSSEVFDIPRTCVFQRKDPTFGVLKKKYAGLHYRRCGFDLKISSKVQSRSFLGSLGLLTAVLRGSSLFCLGFLDDRPIRPPLVI